MTKTKKITTNQKVKFNFGELLKIVAATIAWILLAIIAIVAIYIVFTSIQYNTTKSNQKDDYAVATKTCGAKPLVLVSHVAYLFGGEHTYTLYLPESMKYDSVKTIVKSPFNLLGYDAVEQYYCTFKEANDEFPQDLRHQGIELYTDPVTE